MTGDEFIAWATDAFRGRLEATVGSDVWGPDFWNGDLAIVARITDGNVFTVDRLIDGAALED